MKIIKTKNTILTATIATAILPVVLGVVPVFAQSNNNLLPPPLVDGQAKPKAEPAQPIVEYLSEDKLQRAFENALSTFGQDTAPNTPTQPAQQTGGTPGQVPTMNTPNESTARMPLPNNYAPTGGIAVAKAPVSAEPIPIGQVRLNVALENMPLEKVMDSVIEKVSERTGKWDVRWRLNGENQRIRNERVNINAETDFENFMAYLMERVNNMTGIQLFVKVFEGSRLIVIADNY